MVLKHKFASEKMKVISEDSEYVYISGWANKNIPDDVKERVDPLSIDMSRYDLNPVMLHNHNPEYVCGKILKYEKKPEGLWIDKAAISKSSHEKIGYVRDLVQEGMLCNFSVGFSDGDTEKDPDHPGCFVTRNVKLHEISIVAIPMQMNSGFSVIKSFGNCKSLSEARTMTLKIKGMNLAKVLSDAISALDESAKAEAMTKILEVTKLTVDDFDKILSGETAQVSTEILGGLSSVLGMSADELSKANDLDAETPDVEQKNDFSEPPVLKGAEEIQACVVGKVPALLAEGMTKEEAVAMAVASCSEEKSLSPSDLSDEDWMSIHKACVAIETTKSTDGGTGDNIHILLLQQMVNTLGSIATKMDLIIQRMVDMPTPKATVVEPVESKTVEQEHQAEVKSLLIEARQTQTRLKSLME